MREKNPGPDKHNEKFDRCVQSVKKRLRGVANPYAVCVAALEQRAGTKKNPFLAAFLKEGTISGVLDKIKGKDRRKNVRKKRR